MYRSSFTSSPVFPACRFLLEPFESSRAPRGLGTNLSVSIFYAQPADIDPSMLQSPAFSCFAIRGMSWFLGWDLLETADEEWEWEDVKMDGRREIGETGRVWKGGE